MPLFREWVSLKFDLLRGGSSGVQNEANPGAAKTDKHPYRAMMKMAVSVLDTNGHFDTRNIME